MGWVHTRRVPWVDDEQFIKERITGDNYVLLGIAKTKDAFYLAIHHIRTPDQVFAEIIQYEWYDDGDLNFLYKDMSENCGPQQDDCPIAILDLLSPTDNKYALDWRTICRAKAQRVAAA